MTKVTNNSLSRELIRESIFIIGRVLSVDGRIVMIKVNKNKNHSHILYEGRTVKNVSVGGYVKIVKGFISIIGKVEGEFVKEEKFFNKEYNKEETRINRLLTISLFGHFENHCFKQGIKEMPLVDNECYVLDKKEFNALHKFFKSTERTIAIGHLTEEPAQKICLSINKLFASHIGIFGNTGSGKSNTLARLFTELFKVQNIGSFNENSKFILIDFNGEYTSPNVISTQKEIYELSTSESTTTSSKYPVSKTNIKKLEILSVLLEATEKTQTPFLARALANRYLDDDISFNSRAVQNLDQLFIDIFNKGEKSFNCSSILELVKDVNYLVKRESAINPFDSLKDAVESYLRFNSTNCKFYWDVNGNRTYENIYENHLREYIESLQFKEDEFSKLKLKIIFNYYHEIIKGFSNPEHIRPLLGRMFKKFSMLEKLITIKPDNQIGNDLIRKNFVVISLRDVNIEMKKILPLLFCKQLYDEKKVDTNRQKSLHIVVDEAHNILSSMSQRESETWKDYRLETFEEIIKEGRKFGTFLTIASQRPYDISATIISQLHNYFIHRLINDNDINAISKTVAYLDKLSFQTIPILSVGSCFVAGLASDIPVKVDIDLLNKCEQPKSETIDLESAWQLSIE